MEITGTVHRKYTSDKFAKLTLEVQGGGRYPDKLDMKSFSGPVIQKIAALGAGETVTVEFTLQSEKLVVGGQAITETGKDGKEYPVKVPMINVTGISITPDMNKLIDDSAVPF